MLFRFLLVAGLGWCCAVSAAPRVVVSILPIHGIVSDVMDGVAEPALLVEPGLSPHDYNLKPSDARALSEADLTVWIGPALEGFLNSSMQSLVTPERQLKLLDVQDMIVADFDEHGEARHDEEHHAEEHHAEEHHAEEHHAEEHHDEEHHDEEHHDEKHHAEEHHAEEHHDEEQHAEEQHADEHVHDHGPTDPHIWLSPHNAEVIALAVAETLTQIDPANAAVYRSNAEQAAERYESLAQRLAEDVVQGEFIVYHEAYGYLEATFGFRSVGAVVGGDGLKPGVQRIRRLRETIEHHHIHCAFGEVGVPERFLKPVVEGSSARIFELDPLGSRIEPGVGHYEGMLESLVTTINDCLRH